MREKQWTPDGMKMIFNSGHKAFDRQVVCIGRASQIGGGCYSTYIRPKYLLVNPVNQPVAAGHLRDFDLGGFRNMPQYVRRFVEAQVEPQDAESVALYELYHYNGEQRIVHGYIVTTGGPEHKLIKKFYTGPTHKSQNVIDLATEYITN